MATFAASLFDAIEDDFVRLVSLTVRPSTIHRGLPDRPVSVVELQSILLHPSTPFSARDAVLAELIRNSRNGDPRWMTAVVGITLPAIRRSAGNLLTGGCVLGAEEIEAEMVAGLVDEVATMDLTRGHLASRLSWAAYRRALHSCTSAAASPLPTTAANSSSSPHRPWGHPDLVLADAVDAGAVTATEASLIAATRLEGITIKTLSRVWDERADTIRHRRARAERRLVAWLTKEGRA